MMIYALAGTAATALGLAIAIIQQRHRRRPAVYRVIASEHFWRTRKRR
jgi:hypothetical protein